MTDYNRLFDDIACSIPYLEAPPTYHQLRTFVLESVRDLDGDLEGFSDFETFYSWFEAYMHYEQADNDTSPAPHKLLLELVFQSLQDELCVAARNTH